MPIYMGVGGARRELREAWCGVSGVRREFQEVHVGISGVKHMVWQNKPKINYISFSFVEYRANLGEYLDTGDSAANILKLELSRIPNTEYVDEVILQKKTASRLYSIQEGWFFTRDSPSLGSLAFYVQLINQGSLYNTEVIVFRVESTRVE